MYARERPQVVIWYRVYCALMVLLYLVVAAIGVLFIVFAEDIAEPNEPPRQRVFEGIAFGGAGLVMLAMFCVGPFLPRTPAAWIYGIVLIAIGMTSVCCMPATVPLLIFWIKPETQQYFGKGPKLPEWEDWR